MICCTANGPRGLGMISDCALMRDGPDAADIDGAPIDPVEISHRAAPAHPACGVCRTCRVRGQSDRLPRIILEDFGTVGAGGDTYRSWLPAWTAASAPFSKSNPGRTWRP